MKMVEIILSVLGVASIMAVVPVAAEPGDPWPLPLSASREYRATAEFEPAGAFLVSQKGWLDDAMLLEIIKQGTQYGGARAIVLTQQNVSDYETFLSFENVDLKRVHVVQPPFNLNGKWVRDFGPISIYALGPDGEDGPLAFLDLHYYDERKGDDAVAGFLADEFGAARYGLEGSDQVPPDAHKLYLEGGNFITDGKGTCILSNDVPADNRGNPDGDTLEKAASILKDYFGCVQVIWLKPMPGSGRGHVDIYAKLLLETDILMIDFPDQIEKNGEADAVIEENVEIMEDATNLFGEPFFVHRVVIPPVVESSLAYPPWVYKSYTNSVILNDVVMVPTFNAKELDKAALGLYREILGDAVTVVGIDSRSIVEQGGALHCTVLQIASNCGDGMRDSLLEACEGDDLDGQTCESIGFMPGELACNMDCTFDTSDCKESNQDAGGDTNTGVDDPWTANSQGNGSCGCRTVGPKSSMSILARILVQFFSWLHQ